MPKQSRLVNKIQLVVFGAVLGLALAFFLWLIGVAAEANVLLFDQPFLMPMVGVACVLYVGYLAATGLKIMVWWD